MNALTGLTPSRQMIERVKPPRPAPCENYFLEKDIEKYAEPVRAAGE